MTDPRINKIQTSVDVEFTYENWCAQFAAFERIMTSVKFSEAAKYLSGVDFSEAEKRYLKSVAKAIDMHAEVVMYEGMTNHDDVAQLPSISDPVPRQPTKEEEAAAITRKRQEDCTRHTAPGRVHQGTRMPRAMRVLRHVED